VNEIKIGNMRKVIFYVMHMSWDNIHNTYYAKEIFNSEKHEECEKFCMEYDGPERAIFIQKAFLNEQRR